MATLTRMAHDHAHGHAHDVRERRFAEGDREAWEREVDPRELYEPGRRDIYNFIDETKIRHLRPLLPASGSAVEIGAGSGRLLIRAGLERPYRLVALDYAAYAMRAASENARRAGRTVARVLGDARRLPFPDASFDLVLSGGLLEHFRDPAPVLREMARILSPRGLFYADIVPRKVSLYRWAERDRMQRAEHMAEGIYESDLPKGAWARLIRDSGLADVRVISAGVYPPYTFRGYDRLAWKYADLVRALDGTAVADVLGWFYMATARKP
ncbi:MAG: methyltransferase domain-containing protein [Chloroflexi bacterium]|nr:methyltransferase domain-containing protein [Chloroflexota bacterium]